MRQATGTGRLTTLSARDAQRKLAEIEKRLARPPRTEDDLFARAQLLEILGRNDDAREAYFALLAVAPTHFGALNNLGNVLTRAGKRRAAQAAYEEAVRRHPQNPLGRVSLGICMLELEQFEGARREFEAALAIDSTYAAAHKGLVYLFSRTGDERAAELHRKLGFGAEPIETLPYLGTAEPIRVLVLVSSTGGNLDAESLLDKHVFATTKLYIEYADPGKPLPPHDLVFNAISDADVAADALRRAREFTTAAPLINQPDNVLPTGRAANAERLRGLEGVVAPRTRAIPREVLEREGAAGLASLGFVFPLLLRLARQHTGRHFVRIEKAEDLAAAIAELPGEEFFAIEYLDARGADGQARKYRVMFIDGKMYPLHLAVSPHWKIHYFSADMTENAANRAEDERFLADMRGTLGPAAMAALQRIERALGLDYAGIDFALDAQGSVLLFEANATMVVAQPGADARWDYRRPAVAAILNAFKDMVMARVRV